MSLSDEDFIVPEEPLEQERFKRRLIATARSLKKRQQQIQANQDLLNDRWTNVLAAEEYGLERPTKSYLKRKLLPQFNEEAPEPIPPSRNAERPPHGQDSAADRPPRGRIKRQLKPNTSPPHLTVKAEIKQLGDIHMTCYRTWTVEQVRTDRSMDHGDATQHMTRIVTPDTLTNPTGPNTMKPGIEAPHIPYASLMK